ncbi:MAG: M23 family metallopeptidase [Chloroflexi bacterium]|nr:M23 family metallopeptidase [Chloroflexota bacterium]
MPEIADVVGTAWAPDGASVVLAHVVPLPSSRITGSPEDFFLDSLDLRSGELVPIGVGERPRFSASGRYLSYWSWDGDLRVAIGGRVVALPHATTPDVRWAGDTLFFIEKKEIRTWADGIERTISHLPDELELSYPHDDAHFSADTERFLVTRYLADGSVRRYLGNTRAGTAGELDLPGATYTEWAPAGHTLLVRYADRLELRDDAIVRGAPLSRFAGPVHTWLPDARALLVGQLSAAQLGSIRFDAFAAWASDASAATATLPDLVGAREFSPDGAFFVGTARTGLRGGRLEIFRCGTGVAAAPIAIAAAPEPSDRRLLRPVVGAITQVVRPTHTGIDIAAPLGTVLVASDDGVVSEVGQVTVGGRRVCVRHPSAIETCQYHTSAALVTVGQRVVRGQPIALIGLTGVTTGPHVHWEATAVGTIVDPLTR